MPPPFRGSAFELEYGELLSHFIYANNILKYSWLNPVFWTLAIELQFYIFIGVFFPLLRIRRFELRSLFLLLFIPLAFWLKGADQLLLMWLPVFGLGTVSFLFYIKAIDPRLFALIFASLSLSCVFVIGLEQAIAAVLTAAVILAVRDRPLPNFCKPLSWLGKISYSLYLLHVPIGVQLVLTYQESTYAMSSRYGLLLGALLLSTLAAYLMWRFVERPAQRWSKQ
jgi:peptidoglycan/LPS O-acetylase OafA/YrhL